MIFSGLKYSAYCSTLRAQPATTLHGYAMVTAVAEGQFVLRFSACYFLKTRVKK